MWGVGARQMRLGVLNDAGVVVVGLDVQLVDVVKMAVGQDVLREGGVGTAECFVGDDKQVNHGMWGFVVWAAMGSLKRVFV